MFKAKWLRHLLSGEEGLAAMEYATMLALIVIVCISAVQVLGAKAFFSFKALYFYLR
ncbi:MAG TPA: Flp family type IVb pilin [Pirellulales bacterium]|nr:Flp family type IVb pilin [Pirellulales bacterium]